VNTLPAGFAAYSWAPTTEELARRAGLDPTEIVRFDGNVPPQPPPSARPGTIASALARVNEYAHRHTALIDAIARRDGVSPENVVLGAGADDLILLCARAFAAPGDTIAIADDPTYPLFRIAAELAGATVGDDGPAVTFCCRPNNPTGALAALPEARPLVVDEAYWEYAGETAVDRIESGVVVLRTLSKAFGLAGARVGYALADIETARELSCRQAPEPVSSLSAALALAALADQPDVGPTIEERERLAGALRTLGLRPLPSRASFLFVPTDDADELAASLLAEGIVVRVLDGGFRVSIRDREDDDLLLAALAGESRAGTRHLRSTAETRIAVRLRLDGAGRVRVGAGAGLYDHLLEQLAFHAGFDLVLEGAGEALDRALGERRGIARYGDSVVPMDDALARAAVDLGGRPWAELAIDPDLGLAEHVLRSLAQTGRFAVHVDARGRDQHHTAEAAFKAVGRALRAALAPGTVGVPSTKGTL
jgi:imidazoleglycerol-phosphate dehydratase/histidinol-phosphatase